MLLFRGQTGPSQALSSQVRGTLQPNNTPDQQLTRESPGLEERGQDRRARVPRDVGKRPVSRGVVTAGVVFGVHVEGGAEIADGARAGGAGFERVGLRCVDRME